MCLVGRLNLQEMKKQSTVSPLFATYDMACKLLGSSESSQQAGIADYFQYVCMAFLQLLQPTILHVKLATNKSDSSLFETFSAACFALLASEIAESVKSVKQNAETKNGHFHFGGQLSACVMFNLGFQYFDNSRKSQPSMVAAATPTASAVKQFRPNTEGRVMSSHQCL